MFPLYKVIEDFGIILCSDITIFILLLALYFLYKAFNKNEKVKKAVLGMKQKLMWDSLLRAMMGAYFIQVYG